MMTEADAEEFLRAAHARMYFGRVKCTVTVDKVVWVLGFAQGTPVRASNYSGMDLTLANADERAA